MGEVGLRALKKAETRSRIAETAARLFALKGYEDVTVVDVARAAEVAEKTVYNYFPTKDHLVLDRDQEELARLLAMLAGRPPGVSPASVVGEYALGIVSALARVAPDRVRGTLSYLVAANPEVREICLEMIDRHADAVCEALLGEVPGRHGGVVRIRLRAYALRLCWIYLTVLELSGCRFVRGVSPKSMARQLRPVIDALVRDIDDDDYLQLL